MKIIITFFALVFSLSGLAQEFTCIDKLLPFNRHSGLHQITKDEWSDTREQFDPESAKAALNFLVNSKLLCRQNEVVIKVAPICATMIADIPQSHSCFIFTNLGYFTVTRDNGRNYNFIFTRDKRFSEN